MIRKNKIQSIDDVGKNSKNLQQTNKTHKRRLLLGVLTAIIVYLVTTFIVYGGSLPTTYPLHTNDVSNYDIDAPRTIINHKETEELAQKAMMAVSGKMVKNEEITAVSLANIESLIDLISTKRERLYYGENLTEISQTTTTNTEKITNTEPNIDTSIEDTDANNRLKPTEDEIATAATSMVSQINQNFNIDFSINYARHLLSMEDTRYDYFVENIRNNAQVIMQSALDREQLDKAIGNAMEEASESQTYFIADNEVIQFLLGSLLKPNVEYDEAATQSAREDAANQIRNNPIMINQGMRIVSQGDIITEDTYDILVELNLTDADQFHWPKFAGISLINLVLIIVAAIFFRFFYPDLFLNSQTLWALILSLLIPLVISFYSTRAFPLSPPVYFSAIIICAYFDLKTSIVLSTILALTVYPMTSFNSYFLPVVLIGSIVSAAFARRIIRENNYINLIIATTISSVSIVLALSLLQEATLTGLLKNILSVVISTMVSVILAIGVMPIFELIFNTVSPIKIIELSQPGHPLMKRLFTEAPGTSQHSMMVANLADAGCEAIGADTNLVRVGAYYHDIGKLENPLMFTENQMGENPHDSLTPEESTRILTAHTEDGLKLGRQHRLPEPVLKMIHEHHGTTVLEFFYHKACQIAEKEGRKIPNKAPFRYHNPLPSFRESAVLMLADSVEAAMKSAKIDNVSKAEKFMRNIFKIKIDQNQLVNSGLSFRDVEAILQAFVQVYAGQFHTRVKYPEQEKETDVSLPAQAIP